MNRRPKNHNGKQSEEALFSVLFEDGSLFTLPSDWEDVFVDYFGFDRNDYLAVGERLRFVVGKYAQHRAWPTKFDGPQYIGEEEPIPDRALNDPEFYFERWDDWGAEGKEWGRDGGRITSPPTYAQIAEASMYYQMRSGLLQKALQRLGSKTKVVTAKQFLKELGDKSNQSKE